MFYLSNAALYVDWTALISLDFSFFAVQPQFDFEPQSLIYLYPETNIGCPLHLGCDHIR